MTLGNGLVEAVTYNNRLQPTEIKASQGSPLLTLGYGYGTTNNNGNLLKQTITLPSAAFTQTYTYDAYNRLWTAGDTGLCTQTNLYDAVGNRAVQSGPCVPGGTFTPQAADQQSLPNLFNTANHWTAASYDVAGNLQTVLSHSYSYDGENRLKQSVTPYGTVTYAYDGEGRRVLKTSGGASTVYVYDAMGRLAAEYGGVSDVPGRQYLTADHLGSTRLVTNSGGVVKRYDYFPFGEQLSAGEGARTTAMGYTDRPAVDPVTERFTGKERDVETGLDYFGFRYFSAAQGRFTSTDPVVVTPARMLDPQMFNLYAYARNNPLKYVDPDGRDLYLVNDDEEGRKRALAQVTQHLTGKERANVGVRRTGDGGYQVYLKDAQAIGGKDASAGYGRLSGLINDSSRDFRFAYLTPGHGATEMTGKAINVGALSDWGGGATINRGGRAVDVFVQQSTSPQWTTSTMGGHPSLAPTPDYMIAGHELFGETFQYLRGNSRYQENNNHVNDRMIIKIDNELRDFIPLPHRDGRDHGLGPVTTVIVK